MWPMVLAHCSACGGVFVLPREFGKCVLVCGMPKCAELWCGCAKRELSFNAHGKFGVDGMFAEES